MDLSDYLKSTLQGFHKQQGPVFGKRLETNTKSKKLKEERKNIRSKLMSKRRLISDNLSPYKTPMVQNKINAMPPKQDSPVKRRLDMLKQWKEQKQQKLNNEKAKTKPVFKVTHVSVEIGVPNLENVNKMIKGRPIKAQTKYDFAPKNYKFKGPTNLAPVNMQEGINKQKKRLVRQQNVVENTIDVPTSSLIEKKVRKVRISSDEDKYKTPKKTLKVYKKTPAKQKNTKMSNKENIEVTSKTNHYELRSRNVIITDGSKKNDTKKLEKKSKDSVSKPKKGSTLKVNSDNKEIISGSKVESFRKPMKNSPSSSELSPIYPVEDYANSSQSDSQTAVTNAFKPSNTPASKRNPIVYISPFVTISRGKDSARKEFHSRKSRGGTCDSSPDVETSTGPRAGAAYFHRLLNREISRIQGLCDEWNLYKEEQKPPEEACDLINVAIGQSQLLLNKKFKQFKKLIYSCESGDSEMPINCEDLHGYWDTAYIQVENLNHRFDNLVKLRANNWEEIIPEKKGTVVAKKAVRTKKVQASSRLKDAIKAARIKAKTHQETQESETTATNPFDGGFLMESTGESPRHSKSQGRSSIKARKSLLAEVLTNETVKRTSSPGLVMWKAAQMAKNLEEPTNTPGRSILKSRRSKSAIKNRPKSVLFKEEEVIDVPVGKLISLTPDEDTSRMSLRRRLTRTKLF